VIDFSTHIFFIKGKVIVDSTNAAAGTFNAAIK